MMKIQQHKCCAARVIILLLAIGITSPSFAQTTGGIAVGQNTASASSAKASLTAPAPIKIGFKPEPVKVELVKPAPQPSTCPNFQAQEIYPVKNYEGHNICPTSASRMIYVSANGIDTNNGSSMTSPVKSWAKALQIANTAACNCWIVFKRGETFTEPNGVLIRASSQNMGISPQSPLVITSYGSGIERPMMTFRSLNIWGAPNRPDFGNLILSGLHFKVSPGTGGTAIRMLSGTKNIVIHDNFIEGYGVNIVVQSNPGDRIFDKVAIRSNVISDAASSPGPGGHSQGIYTDRVKDLIIEDNFIDRNGYAGNRDTGLPNTIVACSANNAIAVNTASYLNSCPAGTTPVYADTQATIFNHNLYMQGGGFPIIVRNNIISRGSSHGLQARSGAQIENNIFSRNPLAAFFGYPAPDAPNSNDYTSTFINNVVSEGNDISSTLSRGFGIHHNSAKRSIISNNIIANTMHNMLRYNKIAIDVTCIDSSYVAGTPKNLCNTSISNNIVYNWSDPQGGQPLRMNLNASQTDYRQIIVGMNKFQDSGLSPTRTMVEFLGDRLDSTGNAITFFGNQYIATNQSQIRFNVGGTPVSRNMAQWRQQREPSAMAASSIPYRNTCRTLATYYDDMILGNRNNDNCAIMHSDDLFERFASALKNAKNARLSDSRFSTQTILAYLRQGFEVEYYTVNASAGAGGSISPSGAVNVPTGTDKDFAIVANPGYRIDQVMINGGSWGALSGYTFMNVNSNGTISATFRPIASQ